MQSKLKEREQAWTDCNETNSKARPVNIIQSTAAAVEINKYHCLVGDEEMD